MSRAAERAPSLGPPGAPSLLRPRPARQAPAGTGHPLKAASRGIRPARSWHRSLAKTFSWRLFATIDTFIISYLVTGSYVWAGSIISIEVMTKMALYFVHERAWGYARWGRDDRRSAAAHAPFPR
jgi:uncharacterized membrane protein